MVQGATVTCGLFRMRFVLPILLRVITYNLSPSSPNHTGVAIFAPFLAESAKRDIFLAVDCGGDWLSHIDILAEFTRLSRVVRLRPAD
jgi:hypothetical protein